MKEIKKGENNVENSINEQQALAETFTLTTFFRSLIDYPYSKEVIDYLLYKSGLKKDELQSRWDGFDKVFGEEYGKKISALSFSTIIEARGLLLDSLLKEKVHKNTVVLEVASGFSPRAINLINNEGFNSSQYIETDKSEIIGLKQGFYNSLQNIKSPILSDFNVVSDDIGKLEDLILNLKQLNTKINKLIVLNEGLLIYLIPEEQKQYFNNLKQLQKRLEKYGIDIEYLSIDLPTHENFTDWLLHEGFTHKDHVDVMKNVDLKILECLHNKEIDFFEKNGIDLYKINKYFYTNKILNELKTGKLDKYKEIKGIDEKISTFLVQKILFAYSIDFKRNINYKSVEKKIFNMIK